MTIRTLIVAAIVSLCFTGTGLGQTVADFFPEQKIIASDGVGDDRFGISVAISGTTALVGSRSDDDNGTDSGSAYIFEQQQDGSWLEIAKLIASDGAAVDEFGYSLAISGTTALVGAPWNDDNEANSGSAYIFEQQQDGSWLETAKLLAFDGAGDDRFGYSVAISGTTALVGAYRDDDNATDSGSAYIFEQQQDGSWLEAAKLTASDGASTDYFGRSVAISGTTALVGAYRDDDNATNSGSAYIFEQQQDGSWLETAKLTASDGASYDYFGYSVAISGTTALVGAYIDDDNGTNTGSAYIFEQQEDGTWLETTKLTASDGAGFEYFGISVAISGTTALVGASEDDDNGTQSGSAYMFEQQQDGTWLEAAKLLASDGASYDYFGYSVAISGTTALVGAYLDDDNGTNSGSSFFYEINSVINLDFNNTGYPSLESALSQTYANEHLAVRSKAFNIGGILDLSGKPLNFIAVEPVNIGNQLMFLPDDGSTFVDSDDVEEAGWSLAGRLIAPRDGSLIFSSLDTINEGQLHQNDCSLLVNGPLATSGGVAYLSDEILAIEVTTGADGVNRVIRETEVLGDYLNDGTTVVHRGTLYIFGDLSGEGTMLGDVDTGPGLRGGDLPSPGDGFSIGGSSILGVDASLRMLDFDWTLGIGGD
ncbi:MAG: FG-GAP repeat protein, partial [Planctomycetota bacterium]|nr:FG-GAP repeat protein [Planctomycetota bacterium]